MHRALLVLATAAALVCSPAVAAAQDVVRQLSEQADIVVAAASHVRAEFPAELDVRLSSWVGEAGSPYGRRVPDLGQALEERTAAMRDTVSTLATVPAQQAKPCARDDGSSPVFCRLRGIDALISAAAPRVTGDEAEVVVAAERNTRVAFPESTTVITRIFLKRDGERWRVVGARVIRMS